MPDCADSVARVVAVVQDAATRLRTADARLEHLGMVVVPKRILGVHRQPKIVPHSTVWRLGALLIGTDGSLWATGTTTRVTEPGRPQDLSSSVERRRAERVAALAGGFVIGDVVNHGVASIALDGRLCDATRDATVYIDAKGTWVRWGTAGERTLFEDYLDDQVSLLERPPEGA